MSVPLAEHLDGLSLENLQAVIDKLPANNPLTQGRIETGDFAIPEESAAPAPPALPAPEAAAPAAAEPSPAEVPAVVPPVEEDRTPGRIRIDRNTDERTRKIMEFQSRNHDATIEDAIAFVDGQSEAVRPAPQAAPAGPDIAGIQARIADVTKQVKQKTREALTDDAAAEVAEDLREQRESLRVELRFVQEQAARQQASIQDQRVGERQASVESALALCPEINDENSPQEQEFMRIVEHYQRKNDPILQNDDLPYLVALQVMQKTGYAPKAASTAPAAPVAPPIPARPAAPGVRTTMPIGGAVPVAPATAPGNARLTPASAPTPAQLASAFENMDLDTLEQVLAKTGEKLAPKSQPFSLA